MIRSREAVRALLYTESHELEVCELPAPERRADEVVLRVAAAGICGSDVHGVATRSARRTPPLIMGHELSGEVIEVGEAADPTLLGQRVAVNPQVPCGACLLCRSGKENVCGKRELIGGTRPGGFSELVSVPARCVHVLPEQLTPAGAALTEPLATCVHAYALLADPLPGTVVVLGAGTIGALAALVARRFGAARLVVSEADATRRDAARAFADAVAAPEELPELARELTGGRGVDLAVDAVGSSQTRHDSVQILQPAGTALWLGMHDQDATIPGFDLVTGERRIQGSFAYTDADFARAVELLAEGHIEHAIPTKPLSLEEGARVFESLVRGGSDRFLKTLLVPAGGP
jgi:2-desacetyl-2-hydroxyethyl bacteriochlorophyllide A dehydrogenase